MPGWLTSFILVIASCDAIRILPTSESSAKSFLNAQPRQLKKESKIVNVDIPTSPDGHLVTSLPLLDPSFNTKHWAGLLPASGDKEKYFFYWLFAPEGDKEDKDIPLLIWLNGGPACSSMDGLFLENGPFRFVVGEDGEYRLMPDAYSWHKLPAYTLYIDQPVGTGLSFTTNEKYPSNDDELNTDFYYFLQQFLRFHADKFVTKTSEGQERMNRPLFFSGESYAGHYNVIFTNHILKQNSALKQDQIHIPVSGAAIGNGWVDPYYQYAGAEAAFGHGLIGMAEVAAFATMEKQCQKELEGGNYDVGSCFALVDNIVDQSHGKDSSYHVSSYDIRRTESNRGDRDFPPGHKVVESYLGAWDVQGAAGRFPDGVTTSVLKALHADASTVAGQRYQECTDPPYMALRHLDGKGVVPDMVDILEHPDNVELLFFNGIMDMVCNHVGNERSLEKLPWKHNSDWNLAPRYAWGASENKDKISGYMREFNNLKYLKIMDAGHMVPLDVPGVAFDMMKRFIYRTGFQGSLQKLDRREVTDCPACPTCPAFKPDNNVGFVVSPSLLIAGALILGLAVVVMLWRRQKVRHRQVLERASLSHYDVELRESRYTDQDEDLGEDKGNRNGVL